MDEFFLKLLIWGMQQMKRVYRTIDVNTIYIDWCRGMNNQKKLGAAWPNTLSEKDYPKSNLVNFPQNFEDIIAMLCKICGPSGIFLAYCVREILVPFAYEYYTTNYPAKDEEMINRALIIT